MGKLYPLLDHPEFRDNYVKRADLWLSFFKDSPDGWSFNLQNTKGLTGWLRNITILWFEKGSKPQIARISRIDIFGRKRNGLSILCGKARLITSSHILEKLSGPGLYIVTSDATVFKIRDGRRKLRHKREHTSS